MTLHVEQDRIRQVSDLLYQASREIRILTHISWDADVRRRFLRNKGTELPVVSYAQFDDRETRHALAQARRLLRSSRIDDWLARQANVLDTSASMLTACGTADFFKYARELYGEPKSVLADQLSTPLALARALDRQLGSFDGMDLGAPAPACHLAETVARTMRSAVAARFGDDAPEVLVVDELSANALAGSNRIRIRRTASFTDKDIAQLVNHEAFIHVATSLNGQAQTQLRILGAGHPGTTKTQEGLAVFAEFITGSIDIDRMRRLSDRVIAIQMAIEGADFIDVYRYFLERTGSEEQAFENARRVCRGGLVTGGAPFTKDLVYLDGLLRVHNFLRAIVATGRADCLRLLFCGKLDIEDVPVLYELTEMGLCAPPRFLPPWAEDLRFLLCYLSYSSFLNSVDLQQVKAHYKALLSAMPASSLAETG